MGDIQNIDESIKVSQRKQLPARREGNNVIRHESGSTLGANLRQTKLSVIAMWFGRGQ